MRLARYLQVIVSVASVVSTAHAQKPILDWAARLGPELQLVTGTAVGADGTIYVVGRTASGTIADTSSFRNSEVYIGKLSPDGVNISCSMTLGGSSEDIPITTVVLSDGTLVIAGVTSSLDFPRLPLGPAGTGQDPNTFLLRVDPCSTKLTYSSYLPNGVRPAALAAASDDSVYLGARDTASNEKGLLLHVDAAGQSVISRIGLRGVPSALLLDVSGAAYATGLLSAGQSENSFRRAFAAKLPSDLKATVYDVTLGEGPIAMGTALTLDESGALLLAMAAIPSGSVSSGGSYSENYPLPFYGKTAAMLARILPDGSVDFQRLVDSPSSTSLDDTRRPVGIGIGSDGRIWLAITGLNGFSQGLPESARSPVNGVSLRSFRADGESAGGETLIPGLRPYSPLPAVAFANNRIAVASINPRLPATAGAADSGSDDATSVVAFHLGAGDAPVVTADREILTLDYVAVTGTPLVFNDPKTILLKSSNDAPLDFTAGFTWAAERAAPPPPLAFSTDDYRGTLPAAVSVKSIPVTFAESSFLAVLAPGAQGLLTIPVQLQRRNLSLRVQQLDLWELSESDQPVTLRLRVSFSDLAPSGVQLKLPFHISHQTPWLALETSDGITPAELRAVIDPRGLTRGSHTAQLTIDLPGTIQNVPIGLTIGPLLRMSVTDPLPPLQTQFSKSLTFSFTLQSSGSPLDFTLESRTPSLDLSPKSGRTPQKITATIDPTGQPLGQTLNAFLIASAGNLNQFLSVQYMVFPGGPPARMPDSIDREGAPGSLIRFSAGTSRCQPAVAESIPWPRSLGSCTLRVNGAPMPLGSITAGRVNANFAIFDPVFGIVTQLPYDLTGLTATVEIEDENGNKNALPIALKPVMPVLLTNSEYLVSGVFERRPGEEILVKLSGLGATDSPVAPWGDLPQTVVKPLAGIEAFVGGRPARVLGAALSRTEIGVWEVRVEVPEIARDVHLLNLRIAGRDVPFGSVVVTP